MITNNQQVLWRRLPSGLSIILNRPETINSLSESMIDTIDGLLSEAAADEQCRFVLFYGTGPKGFCAGGDVKELARLGRLKQYDKVDSFFRKEYGLDLRIHLFPKPVIAIVDGITMGGGLGIAAGAGISIATERTRMAMPETRIGFFPDVGSTGWMFTRCPKGYPEYLGLTGYDMTGNECVRLGFATHFMSSDNISLLIDMLEKFRLEGGKDKQEVLQILLEKMSALLDFNIPSRSAMDAWVENYFSAKESISDILSSLSECREQEERCMEVFASIAERSPTALVLTLKLLRYNEGRSIADVLATELKAARFITRHPDYIEGIRARLVDRDDKPKWQPDRIELVDLSGFLP
ncbi:MAG: enoyl-CoA hydratase/isomerase family protein [Smithellaceae bacterium]